MCSTRQPCYNDAMLLSWKKRHCISKSLVPESGRSSTGVLTAMKYRRRTIVATDLKTNYFYFGRRNILARRLIVPPVKVSVHLNSKSTMSCLGDKVATHRRAKTRPSKENMHASRTRRQHAANEARNQTREHKHKHTQNNFMKNHKTKLKTTKVQKAVPTCARTKRPSAFQTLLLLNSVFLLLR